MLELLSRLTCTDFMLGSFSIAFCVGAFTHDPRQAQQSVGMSFFISSAQLNSVVWARACLLRHFACPAAGLGQRNAFNPAQAQDAAHLASMSRMFVGVQPLKSAFRGLARNARPSGPISVVRAFPSSGDPLCFLPAACYLTEIFPRIACSSLPLAS